MKIGDIVTVNGKIFVYRTGDLKRTMHATTSPQKALYLGKTRISEGRVMCGSDYEPNYLMTTKQIVVLVLQPLQKAGVRYRKPFYALPDDITFVNGASRG